jgi:exodeoxyribonuclease VII large subunit
LRQALEPLRAGREALGRAERGVALARMRLDAAGQRLEDHARVLARLGRTALRQAERRQIGLSERIAGAAPRLVQTAERERHAMGDRLAATARGRLRETRATLQGMERLTIQLAPERTLERGFSITRAPSGALLRDPAQVAPGDVVTTRVAGGVLASRVEES